MPERVWISLIEYSPRIRQKLASKHGVETWQVDDACLFGRYLTARWDNDPERGERLLIRGRDRNGNELLVLLKPVDRADGTYRCVTARMVR